MNKVPTIHVPWNKNLIKKALEDEELMVISKTNAGVYFYKL